MVYLLDSELGWFLYTHCTLRPLAQYTAIRLQNRALFPRFAICHPEVNDVISKGSYVDKVYITLTQKLYHCYEFWWELLWLIQYNFRQECKRPGHIQWNLSNAYRHNIDIRGAWSVIMINHVTQLWSAIPWGVTWTICMTQWYTTLTHKAYSKIIQ